MRWLTLCVVLVAGCATVPATPTPLPEFAPRGTVVVVVPFSYCVSGPCEDGDCLRLVNGYEWHPQLPNLRLTYAYQREPWVYAICDAFDLDDDGDVDLVDWHRRSQ